MATEAAVKNYDANQIQVLEGLDPVRHVPDMYTRTSCPSHIIQEAIDNAADECLGGHAKTISVRLHTDGSVTVTDDGRGIPVAIHPVKKKPTVEVVFTVLHSGGKFAKRDGDSAYRFSGGLHGVGVSVTNALSTRLDVEVRREGAVHRISFGDGVVKEPLKTLGKCPPKETGTSLRIWPDPKFFDSPKVNVGIIERLLRSKAVLMPGVTVTLTIERADGAEDVRSWSYADGVKGYLQELLGENPALVPLFAGERYAPANSDAAEEGEGAVWALGWSESAVVRESYVNNIPTPAGGTHESGLRDGVFTAVRNFIDHHNLGQRGVKIVADDVFGRMSFVLAARVLEARFQGQTKEKLNSTNAVRLVSSMVRDQLELWMSDNVEIGKTIADLALRQAASRLRKEQKVEKRKSSGVAVLPGKLTDCASDDVERNELFIVEGDSAGGSCKGGRDKEFQAVLPLRGKALNSWEVHRDLIRGNNEIADIADSIGVEPHAFGEEVDLSGLRYGKIIVLSDADVDGSHIQTLLLTLFLRHFSYLIARGHVYVARPPLFRIDIPALGKRPARKEYALDEAEQQAILHRLEREGFKGKWSISRFKGLGEMSAEQLWESALNPDTRRLLKMAIPAGHTEYTMATFDLLMHKKNAGERRQWMERRGADIAADL